MEMIILCLNDFIRLDARRICSLHTFKKANNILNITVILLLTLCQYNNVRFNVWLFQINVYIHIKINIEYVKMKYQLVTRDLLNER